ncbi:uncharacterized protein SCODWIG_02492 [Saccharomycodes ludwigii]|uniref:alpha-1,2-Mannosidase n=1 Tax=Saccharomycodes ludwigii TaxID=36035 RepID=A0A376B7Z3_9ASCO|nr:uncharacterized protein SCODWIG_02492 [Saccharomycodes ludwigii]
MKLLRCIILFFLSTILNKLSILPIQRVHCLGDKDYKNDISRYLNRGFSRIELDHYLSETAQLFEWSFDQYMKYGYPFDEVLPMSCKPKTRNYKDASDTVTNDVLGNFSITLIDSLTTFAVMGNREGFHKYVDLVDEVVPIDFSEVDSTIQAFEITIRVIGAFLSAHLYATDPSKKVFYPSYNGHLLTRAKNLADRILPIYLTPSNLPLPRINLKSGVQKLSLESPELLIENNPVAMACPMFEFTLLSYLTLDSKYELITRYAFNKTWELRTRVNLLASSFDPVSMSMNLPYTGIGASIDSFYEYALKGSILFDDDHLYQVWKDSFNGLQNYSEYLWWYNNINVINGGASYISWIDSLSAFFPGLLVLDGQIDNAVLKNLFFTKLWNYYGSIPERWVSEHRNYYYYYQDDDDGVSNATKKKQRGLTINDTIALEWYPLRPELVESTYFLYRATKDPIYLNIGVEILESLKTRFKCECGLCGLQDIVTGERQDRMESFVLGETLKYLFLLFDENNEIHTNCKNNNILFSTEAHPFWLDSKVKKNYEKKKYLDSSGIYKSLCNKIIKERAGLDKASSTFVKGRKESVLERISSKLRFNKVDRKDDDISVLTEANGNSEGNGTESSSIQDSNSYGSCEVYHGNGDMSLLSSDLLNNNSIMFEVDRKYSSVMISPDYWHNEPMELNKNFYWKHINREGAQCFKYYEPLDSIMETVLGRYRQYSFDNKISDELYRSIIGSKVSLVPYKDISIEDYPRYIKYLNGSDTCLKNGGSNIIGDGVLTLVKLVKIDDTYYYTNNRNKTQIDLEEDVPIIRIVEEDMMKKESTFKDYIHYYYYKDLFFNNIMKNNLLLMGPLKRNDGERQTFDIYDRNIRELQEIFSKNNNNQMIIECKFIVTNVEFV